MKTWPSATSKSPVIEEIRLSLIEDEILGVLSLEAIQALIG